MAPYSQTKPAEQDSLLITHGVEPSQASPEAHLRHSVSPSLVLNCPIGHLRKVLTFHKVKNINFIFFINYKLNYKIYSVRFSVELNRN